MRSDALDERLRRYVLGTLSEPECDAIEREYFLQADALDRVTAAEDDLIDDYLSTALSRDEREQFERHYLSTPCHRRRVAVARAIRAAASARSLEKRASINRWLAAAAVAASLAAVAGGSWMLRSRFLSGPPALVNPSPPITAAKTPPSTAGQSDSSKSAGSDRSAPAASTPRTPVVVAISISPILVRGADKASTLAIAPGTDVVRLLLREGERGERPLGQGRAIVHTVGGREVWQGPADSSAGLPRGELARVEIPAALLRPNDYIVELLGTDARGAAVERYRYFLRVRAP
jgi:hypothetical protein